MKPAFSPHKIRKEQLRPLNDSVIVSDMVFDQRISTGGIIIPGTMAPQKVFVHAGRRSMP
jgi:co-chaperonin GroES (HSP10)